MSNNTETVTINLDECISADLALVFMELMENKHVTYKEHHADATDIESFYYEEIRFYCRVKGECREGRLIKKPQGIVVALMDKHQPWTYGEYNDAADLLSYIDS